MLIILILVRFCSVILTILNYDPKDPVQGVVSQQEGATEAAPKDSVISPVAGNNNFLKKSVLDGMPSILLAKDEAVSGHLEDKKWVPSSRTQASLGLKGSLGGNRKVRKLLPV